MVIQTYMILTGVASIFRTLKSSDENLEGHLLYLRKDLFQKYLIETGQTFYGYYGKRKRAKL